MTNPQHIENKYAQIPYGQFQGMINTLENQLSDAQDKLFTKLMKPKSRLEYAISKGYVTDITTDSGREIKVYYLVDDLPLSNQTDLSGDSYIIEQVTYLGRKVRLTGRGEQEILLWLNLNNPAELRFPVRA